MKEYSAENIRNLAVVGHATVGKTTLSEALLFTSGEINRQGKVEDGSTASDYNSDEIERKISISTGLLHCEWKNTKINVLDTPGYSDFNGEVQGALRVTDLGVLVVNAVSGVEVGTESVSKIMNEYGTASLFYVNRMDKEHADFNQVFSSIQERFKNKGVMVHLPINAGDGFDSFVDLLGMTLVKYETNGSGNFSTSAIPDNLQAQADDLHEKLIEMAAESDDALLEKFFEEGTLSKEELAEGIKSGIANKSIFPVLCGAAEKNIGTKHLLDFVTEYCPTAANKVSESAKRGDSDVEVSCKTDAPLSLLIFKTVSESHLGEMSFFKVVSGKLNVGADVQNTTRNVSEKLGQIYVMNGKSRKEVSSLSFGDIGATVKLKDTHTGNTLANKQHPVVLQEINFPPPVIRVAVEPKTKGDDDKISTGLHTLHEQDPTFISSFDPELHQTIISGQGELHLDIVVKRLKDKFGVEVNLVEPKIPYRETIKGKSQTQYKYKKQSGGRGQYGDVWIRLEPLPNGEGFEFVNQVVGGSIPGKFIPAVEKGIRESMVDGILAGCKVVDVKVSLYDGTYHNVDSSEMAFKVAGSMAFRKAFAEAKPVLLEPIYDVEITVPEEYMGDVMGDISGRRGKISGMDSEGPFQIVKAKVPLADLYKYSTTLRSLTHGRGLHRRKFSHYETVPNDVAKKIMDAWKAEREA